MTEKQTTAGEKMIGVGVHDWFTPSFCAHVCCRKCGYVQRRDGKNKPSRGKVTLSLRDEYTEEGASHDN